MNKPVSYKRYRFLPEIIAPVVWIYFRRNTKAAKRLLKRLLKKQGCSSRRMITDKLGFDAAARHQIIPMVEHRSHKGLNNRAENSHRRMVLNQGKDGQRSVTTTRDSAESQRSP